MQIPTVKLCSLMFAVCPSASKPSPWSVEAHANADDLDKTADGTPSPPEKLRMKDPAGKALALIRLYSQSLRLKRRYSTAEKTTMLAVET